MNKGYSLLAIKKALIKYGYNIIIVNSLINNYKINLNSYVKGNLKKGYSLSAIRKALVIYGYGKLFVQKLIKGFIIRRNIIRSLPLFLIFLLLIFSFFYFKPTIIGFITISKEFNYTDTIDLEVNNSREYNWFLENPGDLKSIKLDGSITINGSAKVYLEHNNRTYLIFDSSLLNESGNLITGYAILESIENESITNETINQTINQSLENISINMSETNVSEHDQKSSISDISIINKSIKINLKYKEGTNFDSNDDGIETAKGVIDFTVENTNFNWQVDESKLCTKWEVYSKENKTSEFRCYGNSDCCAFVGLYAKTPNWKEIFYSSYGRHGATLNNVIAAQIIYYNVSLAIEEPYAEIITSGLANLDAKYYFEEISFTDICIETCLLDGFNESFYKLIINISNGTILNIDNLKYSILEETNITVAENVTVANETTKQYKAVINKPVKWVKKVKLGYKATNLTVDIPKEATNISVKKIEDGIEKKVENVSIEVKEIVRDLETYNLITGYTVYEEEAKEGVVEEIGCETRADCDEDEVCQDGKCIRLSCETRADCPEDMACKDGECAEIECTIDEDCDEDEICTDGLCVKVETEEEEAEEEAKEEVEENLTIIIEEAIEELEIEYYTEGPSALEEEINEFTKRITISSDIHYEDILAYTSLPIEASAGAVHLYHIVNETKEEVSFDKYDTNNNGLVDYIEWIIPSLSNQTYEVSITILNVQSYPTIGGNWTVRFNTTGRANLTIRAVDGTTFTEIYDNSSTEDDLEFLEVRCGSNIVNASVVLENGTIVPYDIYLKVKRVKEIDEELG